MPGKAKAKRTRAPRRDQRRERNRQLLIDATIAIVLEQGSGALTMAGVAERAGVYHPAFYSNFRNVEACLEAAVASVAQRILEQTLDLRRAMLGEAQPDFAAEVALTEDSLRHLLTYKQIYLLLLQCRLERSPIGELARRVFDGHTKELLELIERTATRYGVAKTKLRELEPLARYMLEGYLGTGLALLQGQGDLRAAAERLSRYHSALISREIRRLLPSRSKPSKSRTRTKAKSRRAAV